MTTQLQHAAPTDYRMLIGGKLLAGSSTLDVVNPSTGSVFARCPRADLAQLDQAVASAKAAFPAWAALPLADRARLLVGLAVAIDANAEELARLLVKEQGKPLGGAMFELGISSATLRAFAAMDLPDTVLKDTADTLIVRRRSPLGVVAAIAPWNFPLIMMVSKVAPALLAGNTVVFKPAPTTPLASLRVGELCAGIFPPGVINIIVDQNDLGDALTSHPDVAKVTFTGSTGTGRKVMASAAASLKRLTLELGGNDAAIVLDDVDPKEIAPKLFFAAMLNSGQVCLAAKRLYLPDSLHDAIVAELAAIAGAAVVGDGMDPATQFGPLQNRVQYEKVQALISDARARGATIACGAPVAGPGYFIRPTIVSGLPDDARLVREEQFGPVVPVLRYSSLEDAIARANDSEYGLGATVWSSNPARALEVAGRLQSGTVWINKHLDLPPDVAYGGTKQSGYGVELGQQGLEEFTQAKVINMAR